MIQSDIPPQSGPCASFWYFPVDLSNFLFQRFSSFFPQLTFNFERSLLRDGPLYLNNPVLQRRRSSCRTVVEETSTSGTSTISLNLDTVLFTEPNRSDDILQNPLVSSVEHIGLRFKLIRGVLDPLPPNHDLTSHLAGKKQHS